MDRPIRTIIRPARRPCTWPPDAGVPLVRLPVERGVDVGRRDDTSQTALDLAPTKKRTKLVEWPAER